MSKIEITRTELVWPGKYDEQGNLVAPQRVNLPFQVIERVNETRGTREQREAALGGHVGTLFDYWQAERGQTTDPGDDWRNRLIWGDNLYVMGSLLHQLAGEVDLIYIDPPFATGADFSFSAPIGDDDAELAKEQSIIEEKAYRDTWGRGVESYLQMMYGRMALMRELLSEHGSIYVHLDDNMVASIKIILDEIFGRENFVNLLVWRRTGSNTSPSRYGRNCDYILFYSRGSDWTWNAPRGEYDPEYIDTHYTLTEPDGRRYQLVATTGAGETSGDYMWKGRHAPKGRHWAYSQERMKELEATNRLVDSSRGGPPRVKYYLDEQEGPPLQCLWADIKVLNSQARERVNYDTQKPLDLLGRIIEASSRPDDLVADFFSGSGTTAIAAENLGRRWIACDLSRYAIHTSRKRLMAIPDCRPFEILNLGKYERQVWQGLAFGSEPREQQMLIYEYLKFILELYGAQPLAGTQQVHGKKGNALVHVGAVDAPVTIDEVAACLAECHAMKQKELHILGWEWEMGMANLVVEEARSEGIKLLLLSIPREVMEQQAVEKGDIHFFQLAYLETRIRTKGRSATVELTDFIIPNTELIPPDVREKIRKWSDYVDYWAIDWDFRDDTFVNGWTSYRTRQDRSLSLKSEPHVYEAAGKYRILVKVIDVFGNDTSQAFTVEVQ